MPRSTLENKRTATQNIQKKPKPNKTQNMVEPKDPYCPVTAAINMLQEKWVMLVVRELLNGPKGFNELRRNIGHCNPATLSERLDGLVQVGIIEKTIQSTMPPRTNYELSKSGVALEEVIAAIDAWSRKHLKQKNK